MSYLQPRPSEGQPHWRRVDCNGCVRGNSSGTSLTLTLEIFFCTIHKAMCFSRVKQAARSFINNAPANFQKARTFINSAVGMANKGHRLLTHANQGIRNNEVSNGKPREVGNRLEGLTDVGLKKLDTIHTGANRFEEHMQSFNASPVV